MPERAVSPYTRRSSLPDNSRYDPFSALRSQMDRLFDDFFAPTAGLAGAFAPPMDYAENDKQVRLRAELPGVEEKDIDVSIEGDILTIKGEKRAERDEEDEHRRVVERSYGAFQRAVRLPFEPKDSDIEASFKDGVLTVTAKKPPELARNPKRIRIGRS